jgi:Tfp pilus assembly protein PilE
MGGRHESPRHGTDLFMAVIVLALLVILAAVIIPAWTGG